MSDNTRLKKLTLGKLRAVYYDTIVIDQYEGNVVFGSLVDSDKELKQYQFEINKRNNFYIQDLRRYYSNNGKYEIEKRKQSNSDFAHMIFNLKDTVETVNDDNELLTAYIYLQPSDSINQKVYDKLYDNTSIPLLEEWMDFLIGEFRSFGFLKELTVDSIEDEDKALRCLKLKISNTQLLEIVQAGIRGNSIAIKNNSTEDSELMKYIEGLDGYLNVFGETLAERIQNSFTPKFIPGKDEYDEYTNNYDDSCFHNGIELYQAQKAVIQSAVNNLKKNNVTFVIGEMGCGSIFAVLG